MSKLVTDKDQFQRWFTNFKYDDLENGLAVYNGKIVWYSAADDRIELDDEDEPIQQIYVSELTFFETIKHTFNKKLFEICVGKHWSYDLKTGYRIEKYFVMKGSSWFRQSLYEMYYIVTKFLRKKGLWE